MTKVNKKIGKKKEQQLPFTEICRDCAIRKGGKPVAYAVTVWTGECPYCNNNRMLCSTGDYSWPALDRKAVWD